MFTGITQTVGHLSHQTQLHDKELRIKINTESAFFKDVVIGASIMIDGTCLTVVSKNDHTAEFDIMQPTYETTIVKNYVLGQGVNLEQAMLATDRFDGHIVSGHVDGMARVTSIAQDGETVWLTFTPADKTLIRQIVPKGAITVSGVSLTVIASNQTTFTIGLIPHTLANTTLKALTVGDQVNIETDIFAKYLIGVNHD